MDQDFSELLFLLGENHSEWKNAVAPPIYQTSNFCFPDVASFRNAFQHESTAPLYTRGVNPTVSVLREKLAALEKSEDALVLSSGAAAISAAVINSVKAGDHILCVSHPYSWAHYLISGLLNRFGVECTFADGTNSESFLSHVRENTTLIYLESPNSILFDVQDLEVIAQFAKSKNIRTICDNSFSAGIIQQPISFGIDIVIHSATKYFNGHSDVVAGVICSRKEIIQSILKSEFMTLGAIASPIESWLILRGLRTLQLRFEKSSGNAKFIADQLKSRKEVERIYFTHSENSEQIDLVRKQMSGNGGLLSVCFKAKSIKEMEAFCNRLKYFRMAVSWGGYESLQLPICTFYQSEAEQHQHPWNMVRFYFGLEDSQLLWSDIEQALDVFNS